MTVSTIHAAGAAAPPSLVTAPASDGGPFLKAIDRLIGGAEAQQGVADRAVQDLALGKTDNVHNVLLAAARADLSFRLVLEIRNRLTEALQEVLRMQV